MRDKCFCCLKGELQPQPRRWARCVKRALKDDCSALPQWELRHCCEGSSSCSSLAFSDSSVHPWEESPGALVSSSTGVLLARGLRHSKNPERNLRDLQKSLSVDAKEGREKSLKEPAPGSTTALSWVPACPHPDPPFLLAGSCCQHTHLSFPASAFEVTACQIVWSPALDSRSWEGSSCGPFPCQLPRSFCLLAPPVHPSHSSSLCSRQSGVGALSWQADVHSCSGSCTPSTAGGSTARM